MDDTLSLDELRRKIDILNREIIRLFTERMEVSKQIAACKLARGLPVLDAAREAAVLDNVAAAAGADYAAPARALFQEIMRLSRAEQEKAFTAKEEK